jgi:hypothetical protein
MIGTQNAQILRHMQIIGEITPLDALHYCGCLRLAARIYEIRSTGVEVQDRWVTSDDGKRYKAYSVKKT